MYYKDVENSFMGSILRANKSTEFWVLFERENVLQAFEVVQTSFWIINTGNLILVRS